MNKEEYRKRMENPKYKELIVTKAEKNIDKDYVFISYRSSNWKRDLTEITYKLQKEYGLRVYFDKEFAKEDNIWVEQFEENMRSPRCKAVICFFDKGYCSSYATLLEYMFALNQGKKIIPINFDFDEIDKNGEKKDGWKELLDNSSSTGLGEDNGNPGWEEEKGEFDEQFEGLLLLDKEKYKASLKGKYKNTFKILSVSDCAKIFKVIQPKNQGVYVDSEDFYRQFIIEKLLNDEETKNVFDEQLMEEKNTVKKVSTDKIKSKASGAIKNDDKTLILSENKDCDTARATDEAHKEESLTKWEDYKIGEIAKKIFRELIESDKVSSADIEKLQDKEYSLKTFQSSFPILVRTNLIQEDKKIRYYSTPIEKDGNKYYLCSQWYPEKIKKHQKEMLVKWIKERK